MKNHRMLATRDSGQTTQDLIVRLVWSWSGSRNLIHAHANTSERRRRRHLPEHSFSYGGRTDQHDVPIACCRYCVSDETADDIYVRMRNILSENSISISINILNQRKNFLVRQFAKIGRQVKINRLTKIKRPRGSRRRDNGGTHTILRVRAPLSEISLTKVFNFGLNLDYSARCPSRRRENVAGFAAHHGAI